MNQSVSKNNNYKTYKVLITILILLLFCGAGFLYKINSRSKTAIVELKSDKLLLINQLQKAKLNLVQQASNNKALAAQLLQEKQKLETIIKQLSKPNVSNSEINKYKNYVSKLNFKVDSLSKTVVKYKTIIDSSKSIISKNDQRNRVLLKEKTALQSKIESVSNNLYFYNVVATSYKKKESGKIIVTQKASRVNTIEIKFEIAENKLAKTQEKLFYIQIIDSKNNVIGQKATITFGKKELIYSDFVAATYNKETIQLAKTIPAENLEKGNYTINIFDKEKQVLSTSLVLE